MRINIKRKTLLALVVTLFLSVCSAFGLLSATQTANAETQGSMGSVFTMTNGISLRTVSEGMRFRVEMDKTTRDYIVDNENVKLFFVIAPSKLFKKADEKYGVNNYMKMVQKIVLEVTDENLIYKAVDSDLYYAFASVVNIKGINRELDYESKACVGVETSGEWNYTFVTASSGSRNLYSTLHRVVFEDSASVASDVLATYEWFGRDTYSIKVNSITEWQALSDKVSNGVQFTDITFDVMQNVTENAEYNAIPAIAERVSVLEDKLEAFKEYELYVDGTSDAKVANTAPITIDYEGFISGSSVKIGGFDISDVVTFSEGKLSIPASAIAAAGSGKKIVTVNGAPKISIIIYSAVLKTVYDIQHFTDYATRGAENSYDGYFVLGSNIDMSGKEITASGIKASDKGFIGTFDGRGYSLTGGSYGRGGLFGIVSSQGVVKNVAVENIQMYSYATYDENNLYSSVIARTFRGTLEGIIIKVDGIVEKESGAWGCYALGFDIAGSTLKNVVIYENSNNGANAFVFCGSTSDKNTTFENVYFRPANGAASNKKYIAEEYYANNIGGTVTQIISDANCNDITDIDGEYWDLSGTKASFKHNVALNEEYKLFVAGEGDAQVANTAALEIPYAEFEIGSIVKIDGVDITDKVSYVSGKIIIEANAFTSIGEKLISINGVPKIKVRIITAELNTPYDILHFTDYATRGAENSYDGYFVLGSNIDMSGKEITASGIKASDKGFIGTFDGRGYSLTGGSYGRGGLFGIVSSQGVVKNIAVENIQMYSYATYDENNLYSSVFARTFRGTLEGIIIKVDGIVEKESGAWGCYALGFDIAGSTLKNVVIYENSNNGANAFVFCGSTSDKNTTFENVYFRPANGVASNKKYIAEEYYANNIGGTVTQIISDTNCNDITDIDGEYWDLTGAKAVFTRR